MYNEDKARKYRSYPLLESEKGCFSSHIGAWLKCIQYNDPVVVLEDDCMLLPDFFEKIKTINSSSYEYVKLERRSDGYDIDGTFMINKKNRSGAVGYYLSPLGAFKFISSLNTIYMPVDHYIGMPWKHKVAPIGLVDQVISHKGQFTTNIQHDRKKVEKINSKNKWLRFLRKTKRWADNVKYYRYVRKCRNSCIDV